MTNIDNSCQYFAKSPNKEAYMTTMNVSLPDAMKSWVEQQSQYGRYSNANDYVRDLIRKDQDQNQKIAQMQSVVNQGISSGVSQHSMAEILALAKQVTTA